MDSLIPNLMKMGYSEDKVRRALELANNDPVKTFDFLVNGLPPQPAQAQPNIDITNQINNMNTNANNKNENDIDNIDDIDITNMPKTTINAACICGAKLLKNITSDAYIYCDGCNELMQKGAVVYTCPKDTEPLQHRSGYDLCPQCAKHNKSSPPQKTQSPQPIPTHTNNTTEVTEVTQLATTSQNNYNTQNVYNPLAQMMNMATNMNVATNMNCAQQPVQNGYKPHNADIYYEWEWSSHGGSRWNKYNSDINDILNNKLDVGKTIQIKIRDNIYNITKYDDGTAIQKNPKFGKTRKVRRVELNRKYENDGNKHESGIQRIIEVLGCNYEAAQCAYKCCHNKAEAAINYLLERKHANGDANQQTVVAVQDDNNNNMQHTVMQHVQNNNMFGVGGDDQGVDSDIGDIYGYSEDEKKEENEDGKDGTVPVADTAAAKAAMCRYNETKNKEMNDKVDIGINIDDIYGYSDDETIANEKVVNNGNVNVEKVKALNKEEMGMHNDDNEEIMYFNDDGTDNVCDEESDMDDIYGFSDDENENNKSQTDNIDNKKAP